MGLCHFAAGHGGHVRKRHVSGSCEAARAGNPASKGLAELNCVVSHSVVEMLDIGLDWGSANNVAEATSIADAAFNADIAKCSKHVVCAGPSLSPHALTVGLRIIAYAVASFIGPHA